MDVYEAIYTRRDVRHFRGDPLEDAVLERILDAAHHAGSVGFMQPWNFIVIRDPQIRRRVKTLFEEENALAAENYSGSRRQLYQSLKLEGILESAVNLCVTCDRSRADPVLGRNTMFDADLYSTCCAVQNLWLAARAEGVGVGWLSILRPQALTELLELPETVVPVAYLCLGYPQEFRERPMLEEVGWRDRLPLDQVIFYERWGQRKV
ncbi:MAG TPA: 5,6-dimethylbenzimidazole synthase [Pirellulales bacterium]|nr:5,6-dimethylbenzimidazole synthase [Pirellulales bacterium]